VQLDCSLAALRAGLAFTTHVLCTLVYSLTALQAGFEDPFLGPPTTLGVQMGNVEHVLACLRERG
jgi:hypothetical protein